MSETAGVWSTSVTCPHGWLPSVCGICSAPSPTPEPVVTQGWACPSCGACYAPFVQKCWVCPKLTVATNTPGISAPRFT